VSTTLGIKDTKLRDINIDRILYLMSALEIGLKYVLIIIPDEKSENAVRLVKESKYVICSFALYIQYNVCEKCDFHFRGI